MVTETKQELKESILHYLPHGKERAITGELLASRCGEKGTRAIRRSIRELVERGHLIGLSVKKETGGYYFIQTP